MKRENKLLNSLKNNVDDKAIDNYLDKIGEKKIASGGKRTNTCISMYPDDKPKITELSRAIQDNCDELTVNVSRLYRAALHYAKACPEFYELYQNLKK